MDSLQLWSAHQIAEMRPITKFCYFRTATSTTGTATAHSHCPRCRLPRHHPHYNAAIVSSCVCEVCCCGRMTLTCDLGDDVNSSNACGMPSVTMVLSVSPPAHNHHSLSVWRQSQLCVCNIRSFQINVSKLQMSWTATTLSYCMYFVYLFGSVIGDSTWWLMFSVN